MKSVGFYPGEFLLPRCDLTKWSVVACDQFTSQPEYWDKVEEITGDAPSAYKMIFPEARLETENFDQKISEINQTMEEYLKEGLFETYPDCYDLCGTHFAGWFDSPWDSGAAGSGRI